MTFHDKINYIVLQVFTANYRSGTDTSANFKSLSFVIMEMQVKTYLDHQCPTVLENEDSKKIYSPFMCVCRPQPYAQWTLKQEQWWTKTKTYQRVFKARYCTKSKKEVTANLVMSSCFTCLILTGLCQYLLCSYTVEFFKPYVCKYTILVAV